MRMSETLRKTPTGSGSAADDLSGRRAMAEAVKQLNEGRWTPGGADE